MNILITGGAGFGGSGLAKKLLEREHKVTVLDVISPNDAVRLQSVIDNPNLTYLWKSVHDIKPKDLYGQDIVVHMAAQADVPMGFSSPVWTVWDESVGTTILLETCKESNIKKFILASTGNVIGRPLYLPIDEKHPVVPHNPYSAAKASQELLAWSYYRAYGVPVIVMRNGIVYGPDMRKQIFLYIWMKNIYHGKSIVVEGGDQTRDPCFGADTVQAWTKVIEIPEHKTLGQTFQVSYGKEYTVRELADICMEVANKEVPIIHRPHRPGEKGQRECFDNGFARSILGYEPEYDLRTGLKILWNWVQKEELKIKTI